MALGSVIMIPLIRLWNLTIRGINRHSGSAISAILAMLRLPTSLTTTRVGIIDCKR